MLYTFILYLSLLTPMSPLMSSYLFYLNSFFSFPFSPWATCLVQSSWPPTRLLFSGLSSCSASCSSVDSLLPLCPTGSSHSATSHPSPTAMMPSSNSTLDLEWNSCKCHWLLIAQCTYVHGWLRVLILYFGVDSLL